MRATMRQGHRSTRSQEVQLFAELQRAGGPPWSEWHTVARYISQIALPDEHIRGLAYGYSDVAFTLLVATSQRVIILTKEATFAWQDQCAYGEILGVTVERNGLGALVTLHAQAKDFRIVCFNRLAAVHCADYIEQRSLGDAKEMRLPEEDV